MPYEKTGSKKSRQRNIKRWIDEGYPPKQAVAMGYSTQRRYSGKKKRTSRSRVRTVSSNSGY